LKEIVDNILGTLDGTGQEENDFDDFSVFGDHGVKSLSLTLNSVLLVPSIEVFGASQNSSGGFVDRLLDVAKIWFELDILVVQIDIDLEEGILLIATSGCGFSNNAVFHGVQGVLSGIQESLIQVPEIISLDLFGLFAMDVFLVFNDMWVKFVEHDSVHKIVNSSLNFFVFGHQKVSMLGDVVFLSLDKLLKGHWLGVIWKVDK
jgi:hypothetical protein